MNEQCFYTCGPAVEQCPRCKRWYCGECRTMFLSTAKICGELATLPEPICPQCHYEVYWRPALEAQRAW